MTIQNVPDNASHLLMHVDLRTYRISSWGSPFPWTTRGIVVPEPMHATELDSELRVPVDTMITFKITDHGDGISRFAVVQNMSVVESQRRHGWGSGMVRALMNAYPDDIWEVSGPNDQSGPLFDKLSAIYPRHVKPSPPWMD